MLQDPQSGHNPNPAKPYTDPSSYETPSPSPYGVPPSPNPYQDPSQSYDGEYQQPPYGMPPQGAYGKLGYDPNQGSYSYGASSPLPLREAINQLPNQYIKILTKPSPVTFVAEMGKASWDILWVQLVAYAVITGILDYVLTLLPWVSSSYTTQSSALSSLAGLSKNSELFTSVGLIIMIPIGFFIGQGITYLLAKAFSGNGTFLRQGYTYLLVAVPLGIISYVLAFIPYLGNLASIGLGIYGIVLQIFSVMSVHRLSGGKATAVVLIPIGVGALLVSFSASI
jgi:hypothetical protein